MTGLDIAVSRNIIYLSILPPRGEDVTQQYIDEYEGKLPSGCKKLLLTKDYKGPILRGIK